MRVPAKRLLRWLGGILSVVGVAYIVWRFATTEAIARLLQHGVPEILVLHAMAAVGIYTAGLVLLSLAWWWLMSAVAPRPPEFAPVAASYATSQFAKYLPGNVGQYLARHAMLRRLQLPHGALLAAAVLEAASLVLAALAWALPAAGTFIESVLHISAGWLVLTLFVAGVIAVFMVRILLLHTRLGSWVSIQRPTRLLGVLVIHAGFFGMMVLSLIVVASAIPGVSLSAWLLIGVATVSWLAGFVIVGSPGGLGVREAVFVELLRGTVPESTALLLAAAFRVVTFIGDLAFLVLGLFAFALLRRVSKRKIF